MSRSTSSAGKARSLLPSSSETSRWPLRRTVQRFVENPISKELLVGGYQEGDTVLVDTTAEGLTFSREAAEVAAGV